MAVMAVAVAGAAAFLVLHGNSPAAATAGVKTTSASTSPPSTSAPPTTTRTASVAPPAGSLTTPSTSLTSTPPASPPVRTPAPTDPPTTVPASPHFDTPQAAMTYLAAAWNSGNTVALDYVTTPAGRAGLVAMRAEAVDLRLDHCTERPQGDYLCYLDHGNPTPPNGAPQGNSLPMVVLAAPAETPGWYMTVFVSCD